MKNKSTTLTKIRSKTTQKSNSKDNHMSLTQTSTYTSSLQNETKYSLKTLFIKNLKTSGETYPINRNIRLQSNDTIYNCLLNHYSMTPKCKRNYNKKQNPASNIDNNQLKKRIRKPFEYSFNNYLIQELRK